MIERNLFSQKSATTPSNAINDTANPTIMGINENPAIILEDEKVN